MADKLPLEEPFRRAVDANMRYYQALGRITQDYWKSIFGIVRELPIRFGASPPVWTSSPAASATSGPSAAAAAATLVLEATAGGEAHGVFLVENRLARVVSTSVVTSAFTNPSGRALQPTMRVEPGVVTLPPGGRTLVQIFASIDEELEADVPYRGEVNVPGLSEHGIPVLLRRVAGERASAQTLSQAAATVARAGTAKKRKPRARRAPTKKPGS